MQLKALAAILSVACTIGVQAAPNPLDRAADVKGLLKRSYSHGRDMSQVSKRAMAMVPKKRDSNQKRQRGKQCKPKTTAANTAPQPQQSQTTPTPQQPQSTPAPAPEPEQPQTTPAQPQTTPTPQQPQDPQTPEPVSSPAPEATSGTNTADNSNNGSGNTGLDPVSQAWLDEHNAARAQHGADAMTWDNTLADFARDHGNKCVFEHTKNNQHGENLAAQTNSLTPKESVDMWMAEVGGYSLVDSLRIKSTDCPLTVHLLGRRV